MAAVPGDSGGELRWRATAVCATFGAAVLLGLALLVFFEPDVQQAEAGELVARKDGARAFFAADYVFILIYALASPLAISRFGAAAGGPNPWWLTGAVLLLPLAGLVDAAENALLLSGTGSVSPNAVDLAHALAIPKIALFVAGTACSIAVLVRAIRVLRSSGS
jgi:hypothetical protein